MKPGRYEDDEDDDSADIPREGGFDVLELLQQDAIKNRRGLGFRPSVPRPAPGAPAICCSFGPSWPFFDSVWTIDCPATRTPSYWRARLPEGAGMELDAHPGGMDDISNRVRLGAWLGHHQVPDLPIGVPAPPPDQLRVEVSGRFTMLAITTGPDGVAVLRIDPVVLNRLISIAKGAKP